MRKSIPVGIGAVVSAASTPNRSLLSIRQFETSWRHDACRRCRRRSRNRNRRRGFLLDVISCIDQSWWRMWSYGRHEALLPAFEHTTINKHTRHQTWFHPVWDTKYQKKSHLLQNLRHRKFCIYSYIQKVLCRRKFEFSENNGASRKKSFTMSRSFVFITF